MNYIQIEFRTEAAGTIEILIALLFQSGFESFEEEENTLKAFIKEDAFKKDSLDEILKIVPVKFTTTIIPPQNWNTQWESSFEPVLVNDFAAIRAGFHLPVKNVKHEIIITPKMSFGTGHHATTYLMISQMSHLIFADKSVLDFGTGTGVLSILAEKMGAKNIDAIDNDDWSIENARENIGANNCRKIKINKGDTVAGGNKYDIILANINLNVISQNLPGIAEVIEKETLILLSGFLEKDTAELSVEIQSNHISIIQEQQKDGWICLLCTKD
jgi:ribosomal protein L11 methyltransferase